MFNRITQAIVEIFSASSRAQRDNKSVTLKGSSGTSWEVFNKRR